MAVAFTLVAAGNFGDFFVHIRLISRLTVLLTVSIIVLLGYEFFHPGQRVIGAGKVWC